jgi:hypothetical protein
MGTGSTLSVTLEYGLRRPGRRRHLFAGGGAGLVHLPLYVKRAEWGVSDRTKSIPPGYVSAPCSRNTRANIFSSQRGSKPSPSAMLY